MSLLFTDGRVVFQEELPAIDVLHPRYPATSSSGRFAIGVYKGKGGIPALDIAAKYSLRNIRVYDLNRQQWIYTLDGKLQGIKSFDEFALSPDGTLLGLITATGILEVFRIPAPPDTPAPAPGSP